MKKLFNILLCALLIIGLAGCNKKENEKQTYNPAKYPNATAIHFVNNEILVNEQSITSDEDEAVYVANDIIYYHNLDQYESGNVYGEGTASDKHDEAEAAKHQVVHITKAGTYYLSGILEYGQIAIDLGKNAKSDEQAVVTLVLDNLDVTCTVAPAIIFYNVYEVNQEWVKYDDGELDTYQSVSIVDTTKAGANVIICDGSVNNIKGSYVAKIYKDSDAQKKLYKFDGAFYSKMSLNINGETEGNGILNIDAQNEGLDSEMHLTINGGVINIKSQDDGINTNEDNVSVTTINGGEVHIVAGIGKEGDGIDSNGYLVINGGIVIASANPASDSGLDSDCGSFINGGTVIALGSTMDWAESDSNQVTMNLQFAEFKESDEAIVITDDQGKVVFAYDQDKDEAMVNNNRRYQGAIISCSGLEVGKTYNLYVGGEVDGQEVNGLYDGSTVTKYTGSKQGYGSTDFNFGHGGFPGGNANEGFDPNNRPNKPEGSEDFEKPEIETGATKPINGQPTLPSADGQTPPDGQMPPEGEMPTPPEGEIPDVQSGATNKPNGGFGDMPGGHQGWGSQGTNGELNENFYMNDKVNCFSQIATITKTNA